MLRTKSNYNNTNVTGTQQNGSSEFVFAIILEISFYKSGEASST